jgi:hypothetical protein
MTRKTTKAYTAKEPTHRKGQDPEAKEPSHPADPDNDTGDDVAPPEGNESARAGRVNPDAEAAE